MAFLGFPIATFVADLVCPERCASCQSIVASEALFCEACADGVHRLGPPECQPCGAPTSADDRCAPCIAGGSPIRSARAWGRYHRDPSGASPVANAVAHFKYGGAQRLGRRLASTMLSRLHDPSIDVVVPVPLHPQRLRERGYNQSAVLARHLARGSTMRVGLTIVTRTRPTPSQVTLTPGARAANVADAFRVPQPDLVRGRSVLLIDDVWTSGATARAVAMVLRDAGATTVDVLTFARVV